VLWLTLRRRDFTTLAMLGGLGLALCAAGGLSWALAPYYVRLVIQSTLYDPSTLLLHLTVAQRLVGFDRSPQVLLNLVAMAIAAVAFAKRRDDRAGIVFIACAAQLLLIMFDPSPFPYVYAWSVIPALAGLALAGDVWHFEAKKLLTGLGSAFAAAFVAMAVSYPLLAGHQPPTGSNYRVLLDAPLQADELRRTQTNQLVRMMLNGERQHSLRNQLAVRAELCGRLRLVLSTWQKHPICVHDASYQWYEIRWPDLQSERGQLPVWFAEIFRKHRPDLFIFAAHGPPGPLSRAAQSALDGYAVDPAGFAIRASDSCGTGSSPAKSAHR
jgi:hypothetical protein